MRSIGVLLALAILCIASLPAAAYPTGATVTVQVFYSDGQPAYGISVALQNGDYGILANGTTGLAGTCAFNVSPGSNAIRALITGPGYNLTTVWYGVGPNVTIDYTLPGATQVSGTVLLGGMAAGNPVVVLDDSQVYDTTPYNVTQQNGSVVHTFTVNGFTLYAAAGNHTLYAAGYYNGTVYLSGPVQVNVSGAGGTVPVVLQLNSAGTNTSILAPAVYEQIFHTSNIPPGPVNLLGWIVGADGKPLANATVTVQDYYLNNYATAHTDDNGTFAFYSVNVSTNYLRFKVLVPDNGTQVQLFSQFYPAQNTYGLQVIIQDYPIAPTGFIYGIITNTTNSSNPVPLSGTVYLSNGMKQVVSPDRNQGQFFFNVTPGNYTIYAEHDEGDMRITTATVALTVVPEWSPVDANPTVLVLQLNQALQPVVLAVAAAIGLLCLAGAVYVIRKWL